MKTQLVSAILLLILFTPDIQAQTRSSLSGRVIDKNTGAPVSHASIRIHDLNRDVIAGDSGEFRTSFVPEGSYLVEVSHIGYAGLVERVNISGNTILNFQLSESIIEHEGVTITGVTTATRLRQSPQPVALLKKAELFKISSPNIISSLTHVPGVNALTTGPAIAKPFIRGLGYNRVLVIQDGIRQEGQQWGDEHGIEIDDYSVQRVEVLKGPASLVYGSDALAGVIHIQSLVPASEGTITANVASEYQSNSRLRGFFGNLAGSKNGFSFHGYGSYKGAQDYRNSVDGRVFNSKFRNGNWGGMAGYAGSWGHSFLRFSHFDQRIGMVEGEREDLTGRFLKPIPGGMEEPATEEDFKVINPFIPYQRVQHFKVSSDNDISVGRLKLNVLAGLQKNNRKEFGDADEPTVPEAWFDLTTANYLLKLALPYKNNWKTSVGVSGMFQQNKNKGEEAIIPDYSLFDIGSFVFSQFNRDKLFLSGGIRLDHRHLDSRQLIIWNETKFEAFTRNFANLSGSAGLSYEATEELTLKMNLARGFRAPSLPELASKGAHEGTNRYELGDRSLHSESSLQWDAGVEYDGQHITMGAGFFVNAVNRFIYNRKLAGSNGGDSVITDPVSGNLLTVFQFDQQDATLTGVEFNMDLHPHPLDWLHFENTFSWTRARFSRAVGGTVNVPAIPAARWLSQIRGNLLPKGNYMRNLYLSLESDYTFRQGKAFTAFDTETTTESYWLLHASAGFDIMDRRKAHTVLSIGFSVNNLTDQAYQHHLSRLKYTAVNQANGRRGVFNEGRNFTVKINVPMHFDWK